VADVTTEIGASSDQYHFLIRRLHSLSGIIPVGVFLCIHLSVNATIMAGSSAFQFAVDQIHQLNNLGILKLVEIVFIMIPIAFHAVVGVIIWLSSQPNLARYRYGGNIRYTLQRWTGILAIVFIIVHLRHVHWILGSTAFDPHDAPATAVSAMAGAWTAPIYLIGVLCAVFHLANGIWTFLITWGITIGPAAQRRAGYVCAVIGVILGLLGVGSFITLKTTDLSAPSAVETGHATAAPDRLDTSA
jgi:succinate dehydrogenase / fumarate reductase cytochrome b subunit